MRKRREEEGLEAGEVLRFGGGWGIKEKELKEIKEIEEGRKGGDPRDGGLDLVEEEERDQGRMSLKYWRRRWRRRKRKGRRNKI